MATQGKTQHHRSVASLCYSSDAAWASVGELRMQHTEVCWGWEMLEMMKVQMCNL